jgi:2-dehydropantoate 2-reductase
VNIAILGAGAVGSLIGGRLAAAGVDVTLLDVDADQLRAVQDPGLILELESGKQTVRMKAQRPDAAHTPFDLILLTTKTIHSSAALAAAKGAIGPQTWVFTLQNGLGNVARVADAVPRERILVGMTTYNSTRLGAGHYASHGSGAILFWSVDGRDRPVLHEIAELFTQAGLDCRADPQVEKAIWEKVAFNTAMNAVGSITRSTVGNMADHAGELVRAIVHESCTIARAAGVAVDEDKVLSTVAMAFREHRHHRPSMLQDLLAGRPTEVDALNGAVAAEAERLGLPAPLNTLMTQLIKIAEAAAISEHAQVRG